MNEIKLYIERPFDSYSVKIWMISEDNRGSIFYNLENGEITESLIEHGKLATGLKPFLELPRRYAELFLKGISDYNSSMGIITENENLLKGKLQATELHLTDMREITKKLISATIKEVK